MENTATTSKKVFDDEESETISESEVIKPIQSKISGSNMRLNNTMQYLFININSYPFMTWKEHIESMPDKKICLEKLIFNTEWKDFFTSTKMKKILTQIEDKLMVVYKKVGNNITPPPELLFNIFNLVSPNDIRVFINAQDPYPGKKNAVGIALASPAGLPIPASLRSIYNNAIAHKHLSRMPTDYSLGYWVLQGCFMYNTSLTTVIGEMNVHSKIWQEFSKEVIEYINSRQDPVVFVAWGKEAIKNISSIDTRKHSYIASSHPSSRSCNKTVEGEMGGSKKTFEPFDSVDHLGKINKLLKDKGQIPIAFDLISF